MPEWLYLAKNPSPNLLPEHSNSQVTPLPGVWNVALAPEEKLLQIHLGCFHPPHCLVSHTGGASAAIVKHPAYSTLKPFHN